MSRQAVLEVVPHPKVDSLPDRPLHELVVQLESWCFDTLQNFAEVVDQHLLGYSNWLGFEEEAVGLFVLLRHLLYQLRVYQFAGVRVVAFRRQAP